ncbi:hypothetical protein MRX96_056320 [Rhipicephalus microplus]
MARCLQKALGQGSMQSVQKNLPCNNMSASSSVKCGKINPGSAFSDNIHPHGRPVRDILVEVFASLEFLRINAKSTAKNLTHSIGIALWRSVDCHPRR